MQALVVNGAVHGAAGNTAFYCRAAAAEFKRLGVDPLVVHLADGGAAGLRQAVRLTLEADVVVYGTGTYWDSHGSPLQSYLEMLTEHEASSEIVGKPAGVIVTMDSVGGQSVAYRLQGVLSQLGMLIPPLSALVLSRVGSIVTHPDVCVPDGFDRPDDVWRVGDIDVVVHNTLVPLNGGTWRTWPIAASVAPLWPNPTLPTPPPSP